MKLWTDFWFKDTRPEPLQALRIAYGLLVLAFACSLAPDVVTILGDHTSPDPSGYVWTNVFAWVPATPFTIHALWWVLTASALCLTAGLRTPLSAGIVFVCLSSIQERNPFFFHGGDALMRLLAFYLVVSHFHRTVGQRLIQLQVCLIYLVSVGSKTQGATWMAGTAIYYATRLSQFAHFHLPYILDHLWTIRLLTWGTLLIELCMVVLVWFRPVRYYVLAAAVLLHLGIEYCMDIPFFEWTMLVSLLIFVDGEDLARIPKLRLAPVAIAGSVLVLGWVGYALAKPRSIELTQVPYAPAASMARGSADQCGAWDEALSDTPQVQTGAAAAMAFQDNFYRINEDGTVVCLDQTLHKRWSASVGANPDQVPAATSDHVFVSDRSGHMLGLDSATGHLRWQHDMHGRIATSPVVQQRFVGVGVVAGHGALVWLDKDSGLETGRSAPLGDIPLGIPTVAPFEPTAYVACHDGVISASDLATGTVRWTWPLGTTPVGSVAAAAGRVVVCGLDGSVAGLNAESGKPAWTWSEAAGLSVGATVLAAANTVYVCSANGDVECRALDSGAHRWRVPVGGPLAGAPMVVGRRDGFGAVLVLATGDGRLVGLDAVTGQAVWERNTHQVLHGDLWMAQGRACVPLQSGGVALLY